MPIGGGALFDQVLKLAALKDAGVFGEQAEQQADQIDFQLMAGVTDGLELVVQPAHAFRGLDVDRVLFFIGRGLIPGDEAEPPDVFIELFQGEFMLPAFFQVIEAEAGEVGNEDIAGQVSVLDAGEIVLGLLKSAGLNPCRVICVRPAESLSKAGQ